MCEFTSEMHLNKEAYRGRSVAEMFPKQSRVIPYERVRAGHCMTSGVPLSHEEMHPPRRCSRSLSEEQYGYIVNNRRNYCSMCHTPLSADKIQGQKYQPREIKNHFCAECIPYWSILHSKVVGEDMSFLADEQHAQPIQLPAPEPKRIRYDPQPLFSDLFEQRQAEPDRPLVEVPLKKNENGRYEMDRDG